MELRHISQNKSWLIPRELVTLNKWFAIDDPGLVNLIIIPNVALSIDEPSFNNSQ